MVKVFISHSSKDAQIIDEFIDNILCLPTGLRREEIAFTSMSDTGVNPGEDIAKFIKDNIASAEVVFLMISENYKDSEVCLNEMGAAWALERNIIPVLLPNMEFSSLGWLNTFTKALKIDDASALDSLYKRFCGILDLKQNVATWSSKRNKFLKTIVKSKVPEVAVAQTHTAESVNIASSDIDIFDASLYMRCVTEGEYQVQLDFRIKCLTSDIYINDIELVNDNPFMGTMCDESDSISLKRFVFWNKISLQEISIKDFDKAVTRAYDTYAQNVIDLHLGCREQRSMSFHMRVMTTRMPDGYEDMPKSGWHIRVSYDHGRKVSIPVNLTIVGDPLGYFSH